MFCFICPPYHHYKLSALVAKTECFDPLVNSGAVDCDYIRITFVPSHSVSISVIQKDVFGY